MQAAKCRALSLQLHLTCRTSRARQACSANRPDFCDRPGAVPALLHNIVDYGCDDHETRSASAACEQQALVAAKVAVIA